MWQLRTSAQLGFALSLGLRLMEVLGSKKAAKTNWKKLTHLFACLGDETRVPDASRAQKQKCTTQTRDVHFFGEHMTMYGKQCNTNYIGAK